jgi:hypothetical protein
MKRIYMALSTALFLFSCKTSGPDFEYVKFEDFKYEPAQIAPQTQVQVLSFSGGKACDPNTTYYYQFIGINTTNGDTVRILSPCQKVPDGLQPETGGFTPWDSTSSLVDQALEMVKAEKMENKKRYIVFNKHLADIEKGNYKTAIGTLGFNLPK